MKRCSHGFTMGLCWYKSCPHTDGFKNDYDAARHSTPAVVKARIQAEEQKDGKLLCHGCGRYKETGDFHTQQTGRGFKPRCKNCDGAPLRACGALAGAASRTG